MFIERPPRIFRMFFPGATFRINTDASREVFLTFDDGPHPRHTPAVLDILDKRSAKATFFMVGENAARYPDLVEETARRGHTLGNHTMHHLQGRKASTDEYIADVAAADALIHSRLFRPPHGLMTSEQRRLLLDAGYKIVMYDLVTRDYDSRISAKRIFNNVCRYVRHGSIIVFHDSDRSAPRMVEALPRIIDWLADNGYTCAPLTEQRLRSR